MTMRFPYRLFPARQAVVSLGGRWVRPRPLVLVTLVGPSGVYVERALLDTAADDTVFPDAAAVTAGLDLTNAPAGEASGVGAAPVVVRYAAVELRLTDGQESRRWPAWVGFTAARLKQPLLGFAGCLQFFGALFRGDREEAELEVNALYPGS
jgi:aspartyl protease